MRRTADLARAAAAGAAVALLVIGLPAFLVASVGWPLPRQLPKISELADTLTGDLPLETATVWKVLAIILWLAWLQIVIAVGVEIVAAARGSMPRSLPGFSLAHGLVAPLVTAVVLAWPAGATGRASAAPTAPTVPLGTSTPPPATAPLAPGEQETPGEPAELTANVVEHTVQRRDTLWDLAERYLGDGYRSTEIFELNRGRPQPDGGALTDPSVIRPGWVLRIPASTTPGPTADTVTVRPGDSLWEIAEAELGDGHRFTEIVDLNVGQTQPDGRALADPNVIEPGWVLDLPATEGAAPPPLAGNRPAATPPPPAPAAPTPVPAPPPAPLAPAPGNDAAQPEPADEAAESDARTTTGLIGGGIATAGLLAVLERRRRAQLRRRRRGEVIPALDERLRDAELALRHGVERDRAAALDDAARSAASLSGATGLPALDHVQVNDETITIDLRDPAPPPPGFDATSPEQWSTSTAESIGGAAVCPSPALVPIGLADDGADVLIDLETPAVTWLTGDETIAGRLLTAMVASVTTAPWSEHAQVLWVGSTSPRLDGVERVASLDDALDALEARVQLVARALAAARCTTVAQARAAGVTPDMWTPCVVLSSSTPEPAQVERIEALADLVSAGVALVTGAASAAPKRGRRIHLTDDGTATVDEDLTVRCQLLDTADLDLVIGLIEQTDEPCVPNDGVRPTRHRPDRASTSSLDDLLRDADVVVRVLGEVEAVQVASGGEEGIAVPKQKSLEAVTYLALREGRVDREDLQAALWPAGANSAKTFHNTIWAARKMLADVGTDLFPEPAEGHYLLSERVVTDYALFNELTARAEELDDPVAAADLLAAALTLVRGEPFTGVGRGYAWAAPHAGLIVAQVVDAAEELAEIRLAGGDWRGAEWAARQGLRAFPCEERLYRLLMRASHAAGSIPGVHRAFQELAAAVADPDDGVEPDDTLHPETVSLLEELTGQRSADRASA